MTGTEVFSAESIFPDIPFRIYSLIYFFNFFLSCCCNFIERKFQGGEIYYSKYSPNCLYSCYTKTLLKLIFTFLDRTGENIPDYLFIVVRYIKCPADSLTKSVLEFVKQGKERFLLFSNMFLFRIPDYMYILSTRVGL